MYKKELTIRIFSAKDLTILIFATKDLTIRIFILLRSQLMDNDDNYTLLFYMKVIYYK